MRFLVLFILVFCAGSGFTQQNVSLEVYAPAMYGKEMEIFRIMDFITYREEKIASGKVDQDSVARISFPLEKTCKLRVRCNNNYGDIIAQKGGSYQLEMYDRDPYTEFRPAGNIVELTFYNLAPSDVNYKVLAFDRACDEFLAKYYTAKNTALQYFAARLDTFKMEMNEYYKNDTLESYFNYHRKFSIARIENLRFNGARNKYEKYDFFIKNTPVNYESEAYGDYVREYYSKFIHTVDQNTATALRAAIKDASPSKVSKALGMEYTLQSNLRLRELMMIRILGECFYEKDISKNNVIKILDSLSNKSAFKENQMVAKNMLFRVTQLVSGSKAPDFDFFEEGKKIQLNSFSGKHLYMIMADPNSSECQKQLELLIPMYTKYSKNIEFLMCVKSDNAKSIQEVEDFKKKYPWKSVNIASTDDFVKAYQVNFYPSFILIDAAGYIVASPALGPKSNGNNKNIENTFFALQKAYESQKQ